MTASDASGAPSTLDLPDLLDTLGVGYARISVTGRILEASRGFARVFGFSGPEDVVDTSVLALLPEDMSWEWVLEELRQIALNRRTQGIDVDVRRVDGSLVTIRGLGRITFADGRIVIEGILREITDGLFARANAHEAGARERRRVVEAIHDDLGQLLTALTVQATTNLRRLTMDDEPCRSCREAALRTRELAQRALDQARSLSHVPPPAPSTDDLAEALAAVCHEAEELLDLDVDVHLDSAWPGGASPTAPHLTRIAREAITNAVRHGGASRVEIRLDAEGGALWRFAATDNGAGLIGDVSPGIGVGLMEHRASLIDGTLDLISAPGGGASVVVTFPRRMNP